MFKVEIGKELAPDWQRFIDRQLDMTLSPVRGSLQSARVRLTVDQRQTPLQFECELSGRDKHGAPLHARTRNANGYLAVTDALARVRREIGRAPWREAPRPATD